jgi:hypothetical protein
LRKDVERRGLDHKGADERRGWEGMMGTQERREA